MSKMCHCTLPAIDPTACARCNNRELEDFGLIIKGGPPVYPDNLLWTTTILPAPEEVKVNLDHVEADAMVDMVEERSRLIAANEMMRDALQRISWMSESKLEDADYFAEEVLARVDKMIEG